MTELLRYGLTSFGPMLDEDGPFVLFVDSEAAIDEARSQEAKVHAATERWSPLSHLQGQRDALAEAVQRVEALPWTSENWIAHAERAAIIAAIGALQKEKT